MVSRTSRLSSTRAVRRNGTEMTASGRFSELEVPCLVSPRRGTARRGSSTSRRIVRAHFPLQRLASLEIARGAPAQDLREVSCVKTVRRPDRADVSFRERLTLAHVLDHEEGTPVHPAGAFTLRYAV